MKNFLYQLIRLTGFLMVLFLAACGGGGGGSDDDDDDASAAITEDNAFEIAQEVFAVAYVQGGFIGGLTDGFIDGVTLAGPDQADVDRLGYVSSIGRVLLEPMLPRQGISASAQEERVNCDLGGYADFIVESETEVEVRFSGCQGLGGDPVLFGVTIDGGITIVVNVLPASEFSDSDLSLGFDDLRITSTDESGEIDGDLQTIFTSTDTAEGELFTTRLIINDLSYKWKGRSRRITDYDLMTELEFKALPQSTSMWDFRGKLTIPKFGGTVVFDTNVPFIFDVESLDQLTSQGVIRIDGADDSFIRIAVVENDPERSIRTRVDVDGDGEPDLQPEWLLIDLLTYEGIY